MNTNMTGFRLFQIFLHCCALDESSLSIGRVNTSTRSVIESSLPWGPAHINHSGYVQVVQVCLRLLLLPLDSITRKPGKSHAVLIFGWAGTKWEALDICRQMRNSKSTLCVM